ncbi:MAG: FUSC family protein [Gammaproteobacteria bacterium]|nr:FUSC family protein [Gammaproteobacteria bacterium]
MKTWDNHTKMAIRGAVVALACILVSRFHVMDRSYWMFLTAFMLVTLSFGEGIYRSLTRFFMTITGCLLGWILYLPLQDSPLGLMMLSLLALFLMIYWFTRSFVGRMLATGVLVVASFSFMGGWTFHLLVDRIQDTFIGALIAVTVNGLVFPEFSKTTVKNSLQSLTHILHELMQSAMQSLSSTELNALAKRLHSLEKNRLLLNRNSETAQYELFFQFKAKRYYKEQLNQINILFFYLSALINIKVLALATPQSLKAKIAQSAERYYSQRLQTEWKKIVEINARH